MLTACHHALDLPRNSGEAALLRFAQSCMCRYMMHLQQSWPACAVAEEQQQHQCPAGSCSIVQEVQ
jgi:hypothetical protein